MSKLQIQNLVSCCMSGALMHECMAVMHEVFMQLLPFVHIIVQ